MNLSDDELVKMACERISRSIFHVKFEAMSKADVQDYIENLITKLPNEREG